MADDVYTHGHQEPVLRSHRWRTAANSAAYLLPHLHRGSSLLDVGCGPGTLTVDLARHIAPGRVTAVDVDAAVVAGARAAAEGAAARGAAVDWLVGDFRRAVRGRFDVVHAHQVLQHLADPVGALRAMAALTRPGGLVAVRDADYPAMFWAPADPALDRWREIYLAVTRRNGADAAAGRRLPAWCRAAGLEGAYATSTWTFAAPEERSWWAGVWADRCVGSSLASQAVAYGIATDEELAEVASGWRRWAAAEGGVFVVPHGELLARGPA